MKQTQIKIIREWEWLVTDDRAVKLVTSTLHSCYVTDSYWAAQTWYRAVQLWDSSWAEHIPAHSLPAPLWPNRLQQTWQQHLHSAKQQIAKHPAIPGHAHVAKCATLPRGKLPAAPRQGRLHSISTGDNRALIVWDNKSHRECANVIGWAHLTYAQQSDIWQLVTFLPQMLKGFVLYSARCRASTAFPLCWGAVWVPAALFPHLQAQRNPAAWSASSCAEQTCCYWNPICQPKPGACWEIGLI